MALSRMASLGEIYSVKYVKQQKLTALPRNIRSFKRISRRNVKSDCDSLATPFSDANVDPRSLKLSKLIRPFGFTVFFSSACFCGATVWQYENMRSHALSMLRRPYPYFKPNDNQKLGSWRRDLNRWWNGLSQGEKIFVPIAFVNVLVFLAWRVPSFHPVMLKYFCSNPGSKVVCWPMVLSTFSHYSLFHLLANMYVLHSFSTGAVASLGKEQFVALYFTGGVVSSFTSFLYKVVTKQPGLSLGASGAIMTILGYVCTQYPDTQLGIILLPVFTFSAGAAIKAIVALDAAGVAMGWKIFDHAAHLGGALLGIAYANWGGQYLWHKKDPILELWHELRGAIK
ncbi:presenilins-associated rhomboid-like protein, mitochondrial [Agrilus planipennis]|uniref:rhomboid protease n=1 Tax=Agrilus planipennis TaxID=224129 RepID=A0A1W4WZ51_AGRPL|nr:presenilins-associated rhomboid-like protein, mitochondrial [Agrilus planipennis]